MNERDILVNALQAICAGYPKNSNAFKIAYQALLNIGIKYER